MKSKTEWKRFHKNPSTACGGPPPLSGEAIFQRGHGAICRYDVKTIYERISPPLAAVPHPFQGKLVILGSLEKGAGSRRLTEEFYCETLHIKQKIPQEPLHQLRWSPSPFRGG